MTFTKVFYSAKQRERQGRGLKLQSTKKTNDSSEEGLQDPNSKMLILQSKDRCQG
jgi:hypothetical protein